MRRGYRIVIHKAEGSTEVREMGLPNGEDDTMQQVTLDQAQVQLVELVRAALRGEQVVIRHGQQAIQLVPVSMSSQRPCFGSAGGLVHMADDFDAPLDDFAAYMQ